MLNRIHASKAAMVHMASSDPPVYSSVGMVGGKEMIEISPAGQAVFVSAAGHINAMFEIIRQCCNRTGEYREGPEIENACCRVYESTKQQS